MSDVNRTQTFLPVPIRFRDGTRAELAALLRHHYRARLPATTCRIRVAVACLGRPRRWRVVAAAALSWPVAMLAARNRHFRVHGFGRCLRFANRHVRTISRVIVHPQFRAAGLAVRLVRQLIRRCPTRYIESSTSMGRHAGFLARCGFAPLPRRRGEPAYFLLDRQRRAGRSARALHPSPVRKEIR